MLNITNKEQILNVQSLLFSLEQDATRLRLYYRQLTEHSNPLNDKTFKWINGSNNHFLSYVSNGNLIRHFIKSSLTKAYSGHYFTIIPIHEIFFENIYWQQALLNEDQSVKTDCVISLLNAEDDNLVKEKCQTNSITKVQVDTHLAYIKHNFGFAMGKIVVFNGLGMIEVYCQQKNLLVRAMGIILEAVSNDCSVNLNGQVRIMAQA